MGNNNYQNVLFIIVRGKNRENLFKRSILIFFFILFLCLIFSGCSDNYTKTNALLNTVYFNLTEKISSQNSLENVPIDYNSDLIHDNIIIMDSISPTWCDYYNRETKHSNTRFSPYSNTPSLPDINMTYYTIFLLTINNATSYCGTYGYGQSGGKISAPKNIHCKCVNIYAFDWKTEQYLGNDLFCPSSLTEKNIFEREYETSMASDHRSINAAKHFYLKPKLTKK